MEKALQDLLASLGQTEAALQPFFEAGGKDAIAEVREKHGPKEAAEVQLAMAYTVNALFFAYLKTQGIDPQSHPVKEELGRVKGYMKKLKEAVAETEAKTGSALRLNKDAASRFIMASLDGRPPHAPCRLWRKLKQADCCMTTVLQYPHDVTPTVRGIHDM